jgi:hypothetical protein
MDIGGDQFNLYATLLLAFFVCLVYLGVGMRVLREDPMSNKVVHFYGYSVCLIAVVSFLVSVSALAGAVVEWSDPLHSIDVTGYPQRSLASFDTYKMDLLNPPYGGPQSNAPRYVPDDDTLRRMYDAAMADRIRSVRLRLRRALVGDGLIALLAAGLFVGHWNWVRRVAA